MARKLLLAEWTIVVLGVAIAIGSLLAFIFVAHSSAGEFKNFAIVFYVLASLTLFIAAAPRLPLSVLMRAAASIAIVVTVLYQFIGYFLFSGLVKGVEVFSGDHIGRLGTGLALTIGWYGLLAASMYLAVSTWRAFRH